jgi:hypothetical protein
MRRILGIGLVLLLAAGGSALAQSTAGTLLRRTSLSVDLLQPTGALGGPIDIDDLARYILVGASAELYHALPTTSPQLVTLEIASSLWGTYRDTVLQGQLLGAYPRTRDRFVLLGYRRYLGQRDSLAAPKGFWLELQAGLNHRWVIVNNDMAANPVYFSENRYLLLCTGVRFGHDWRLGKHWVLSPNVGLRVNRSLLRDPWHRFVSMELNVGYQF